MIKIIRNNSSKTLILCFKLISFICLFMSCYASANEQKEQHFIRDNNGTVLAMASKGEITRVAFNSEIVSINAIAGELEYSVSGKDIYLRAHSDKPINFFVNLEGGWTFKVILSAEDIPATQIFVNTTIPKKISQGKNQLNIASGFTQLNEQISPLLKNRIEKLITVSLWPKKHIGYEIIAQNRSLKSTNKDLTMKLVGIISGDMLKSEKIYITNKTNSNKVINLNEFMNKEYLAVYLTKTMLLPGEQSILVRISEN